MTHPSLPIRSVEDLISAFGGPAAFARQIGVTTEHASLMKSRGSIPLSYWRALLDGEEARRLDLSADFLLTLHEKSKSERAA